MAEHATDEAARPVASVVVPAHQEQDRLATTLRALLDQAEPGEFEVVVVVNGSTDRTAEVARSVAGVTVVELDEASKIAALREGDRRATVFPRLYLDGDVPLRTATARAIVAALDEPGTLAAGVPGRFDLRSAPLGVRWYLGFRQRLPVFRHGLIGAGVYAMSEEGRGRFREWPDVLGDDQFVFRTFSADERVTVEGHHTVVDPPASLRQVIRRGVRVRRGNAALSAGAAGPRLPAPPAGVRAALLDALRSPRGWAEAITFVAVTAVIRLRTRIDRRSGDWQTSRG